MAEPNVPAAPDTTNPAAPTPPAAPAAPAAPAPPPPSAGAPPAEEPPWFKPRLEQARRSAEQGLLQRLGFASEAEAKTAREAATAAANANKTAEQRAAEQAAELASAKARAERAEAANVARAARELAALTPERRAAVEALAGSDATAQLATLDALLPTWAVQTATPAATAATTTTATTAPTATTSPPATAPGGAPNTSPTDHKARYAELKRTNPGAAAVYLNAHEHEIYPRA